MQSACYDSDPVSIGSPASICIAAAACAARRLPAPCWKHCRVCRPPGVTLGQSVTVNVSNLQIEHRGVPHISFGFRARIHNNTFACVPLVSV